MIFGWLRYPKITLTKKSRLWDNGDVEVNLYATFRLIAGVKSFEIVLPPGVMVMDAVREIVRVYPSLEAHWFDQDGSLHAHVHVFLDGNEVPTLTDGFQTVLSAKSVLDFFPPVAGG
ncbi:MAG TPA: ubiquitin-like small modifier protein 1 [Anaerolineaceae bacterium]|nr:ubiquitin-like small modifier protein 1 [Anaerolineaceae bacterium]